MTKIITINSLKGGVSKSTLAINLYYYYSGLGLSCGLIDADLQGSLTEELEDREIPLLKRDQIGSWKDIREGAGGDIVLIDTGPYKATDETLEIFHISDFVLMPCKSSVFDVRALNKTVSLYDTAQKKNASLKAAIVMTQGKSNTAIHGSLRESLTGYNLPVLVTPMLFRTDYQVSLGEEQGIFSTRNTKAKLEISNIATEIQNLISNGRR